MDKDLNKNKDGIDSNSEKVNQSANLSAEKIPENEASKTLGGFAEKVSVEANIDDNTVNENVDFDEISGEIASKVRENVKIKEDASSRIISAMDEVAASNGPGKIDEFLGDIGITRRQLYIFMTIILIFIIGVIVSFYYLLSLFSSSTTDIDGPVVDTPEIIEQEPEGPGFFDRIGSWFAGNDDNDEEENVKEDPVIVDDDELGGVGVVGTIGDEELDEIDSDAIALLNIIGVNQTQASKLGEYIKTYRDLRSVFNTDLFAYLSVVNDREAAYEQYLLSLKGNYEKSLIAISDLEVEIAEYNQRLNLLDSELDQIEGQFFGEVEALNSGRVESLLVVFQELGRKEVVLTSELKARQAVLDRYNGVEATVADRITAIELNKDAFIKGVQVVDYKNIDLDLIINN